MKKGGLINFPCPQCGGRMDCKDSRPSKYLGKQSIRRRRRCGRCSFAVTTHEVTEGGRGQVDKRLALLIGEARRAHEALADLIEQFDRPVNGDATVDDEARVS